MGSTTGSIWRRSSTTASCRSTVWTRTDTWWAHWSMLRHLNIEKCIKKVFVRREFHVAAYRRPANRTMTMQTLSHSRGNPQMSIASSTSRYAYTNTSLPGMYIPRDPQPPITYQSARINRNYEGNTNLEYVMPHHDVMYLNRHPRQERRDTRMGEQINEPHWCYGSYGSLCWKYMILDLCCNKQYTAFERESCLHGTDGADPSATIATHNKNTSNWTKTNSTSDSSSHNWRKESHRRGMEQRREARFQHFFRILARREKRWISRHWKRWEAEVSTSEQDGILSRTKTSNWGSEKISCERSTGTSGSWVAKNKVV